MEKISCGTNRCQNKVKYHHVLEEWYYCKRCALTLFKKDEFTKIGSINEIQYLLTLCKNLWEEVEEYVSKEQLALKWRHELEAHKVFKAEIDSIEDELKETLDTKPLSNFANLEWKISDLKSNPIKNNLIHLLCILNIYNLFRLHYNNIFIIYLSLKLQIVMSLANTWSTNNWQNIVSKKKSRRKNLSLRLSET